MVEVARPTAGFPGRARVPGVPGDIAVIGCDNGDIMAPAGGLPLTTVDVDLTEIGRVAAPRLLEAVDAEDTDPEPGVHAVPCRRVVRESS
ncbi:substrate-binding domain-containing protein [Streptomyces sp. NPDC060027]|uniref:substrate-binding domain-containing protein n=1 Tax=Streptomyces sp. NPDC060027 TaxID=3347040 RepID=UPI003679383C